MTRLLTRRALWLMPALLSLFSGGLMAADSVRRPLATAPEVWNRTELYFGTARSDGSEVTPDEFQRFVDLAVTDKFPDGLTLLNGYGQFKNSQGVLIRERSMLLILLYPPQVVDANRKIQLIREQYKQQFGQESVLRVDSFSIVSF